MSLSSSVIYLDSNATTVVMPCALQAACTAMAEDYGNPSSVHSSGLQAKAVMENARRKASQLLGGENGRLLFVSGATEGIQTAIFSALVGLRDRRAAGENCGTSLFYGATEHKAVPESLHHWNRVLGLHFEIKAIPVNQQGEHDLAFLAEHIAEAGLVCTMAANNETGVITKLKAIEEILLNSVAYWLVDGVQALGKLPLKLAQMRIDYAPFSGHKLYAPKGIGLLYVRNGSPFTPLLAGGGQESSLRSGTENVSGIAALGAVLDALADGKSFQNHENLYSFRLRLLDALRDAFPDLILNAPLENTLPTTLNFSVPGLTSKELLDLFDAADIRVSAGSACSAAKAQPSFVLQAMNLPEWQAASAVRVSFGPMMQSDYIEEACRRIRLCGQALRKTCMMDGNIEPLPAEGVIQLSFGSACTWILADAESKQCIVIDVLPELIERIAKYVQCQHYQVIAVLHTGSHDNTEHHALQLRKLLAANDLDTPENGSTHWTLGQKRLTQLALKSRSNAHLQNAFFLYEALAQTASASATPSFAFCGDAFNAEEENQGSAKEISSYLSSTSLICPAHDPDRHFVMTSTGASPFKLESLTVDSSELKAFIAAHPGTTLVDVREPFEQQLSHFELPATAQLLHVPLTRLANHVAHWLKVPEPERQALVFFCRSGGRSTQAVQCLQRLGYQNAWHLGGGLALWQFK